MTSWIDDENKRGYIGSWAYVIIVLFVIVLLSVYEVPQQNKDIITTIIGMLVSSLAVVVYTLIGKNPDELNILKQEKELLIEKNRELTNRIEGLESMFRELQTQVIDKLSMIANNNS